eukprot:14561748-Heterocapsa_arctica.AAC.1
MDRVRRLAAIANIPEADLDANRLPSMQVERHLLDQDKWRAAQERARAKAAADTSKFKYSAGALPAPDAPSETGKALSKVAAVAPPGSA